MCALVLISGYSLWNGNINKVFSTLAACMQGYNTVL